MTEVGRLVIGVTADTTDAQKQIEDAIPPAGQTAGRKTSSMLSTALKAGAVATGAVVAGVLGTALVKGFQRLNAIDQATNKLEGLGYSAAQVQQVMDNALASVKGTAFGLDEAATLASQAVASGIKPGKQLERQLTLIADTATIAGTSMGDLSDVFGDMYAQGNVTGETIARLRDRGVPALQILADSMGVSQAAMGEMVKNGEVSISEFTVAFEEKFGGAALKGGETFMGGLKNVGAALSRFGASVLGPVFEALPDLMGNVTDAIDGVTPAAAGFGEALKGLMDDVMPLIKQGLEKLPEILPRIVDGFTFLVGVIRKVISVVSDVVGWLVRNRDVLMPIITVVVSMVAAWKAFVFISTAVRGAMLAVQGATMAMNAALMANPIGLIVAAVAGLIAIFVLLFKKNETFRNAVLAVWEKIKEVAAAVWPVIQNIIETVFTTVKNIASVVWPVVQRIIEVVWTAIAWYVEHYVKAVLKVITTVWDLIKTGVEVVWPAIQAIIQGVWEAISWYVTTYIDVVKTVISVAWELIKTATEAAWDLIKTFIVNPVKTAVDVVRTVIGAVKDWLISTWGTIKDRADTIWQNVKDAITKPVRTARDVLHTVFDNLKKWLGTTWDAVKSKANETWQAVRDAIVDPIRKVWELIKSALGITDKGDIAGSGPLSLLVGVWTKVVDAIGEAFGKVKSAIATPIKEAFEWVNDNIITPINTKILDKFKAPNLPLLPIPDTKMAQGGWVGGVGGPTDDKNLVWLSRGEYVVNARSAGQYGSLLEQLNNGQPVTASAVQSTVTSAFNPGKWLKNLWEKGAGGAIRALTGPGMDYLRGQFGGSFSGDLVLGALDQMFDVFAKIGDKLQMAPSKLMEALYQYMKAIEGHHGYYQECLATIHAALDSLQDDFGFVTGSLISTSDDPNEIIHTLGRNAFNTTDPPRGGLVFWEFPGAYGHIAVATGKGNESINNWDGDTIDVVDNIGSNGYVGWLPPERFVSKFDSGGMLPPGWTMAFNGTGKPEPILTSDQWESLSQRGVTNNWVVHATEAPTVDAVMSAWHKWEALQGV